MQYGADYIYIAKKYKWNIYNSIADTYMIYQMFLYISQYVLTWYWNALF